MKNITKSIALVLCIAMLLSMFGCTQKPVEDTAPSTEPTVTEPAPTEPSAEELYAAAQDALAQIADISLELIITTYTTIGKDEFSEQSNQTLTYKGIGTEDMVISMEETLEFSVHSPDKEDTDEEDEPVTYKEIWSQGNVYAELMNTYRYNGPVDAEELAGRYAPVVLLDASLYGSISSEKSGDSTVRSCCRKLSNDFCTTISCNKNTLTACFTVFLAFNVTALIQFNNRFKCLIIRQRDPFRRLTIYGLLNCVNNINVHD